MSSEDGGSAGQAPQLGDVLLVLFIVLAVILAAVLAPGIGAIAPRPGGGNGTGNTTATVTADASPGTSTPSTATGSPATVQSTPAEATESGFSGITGGSPSGSTLGSPPEDYRIGSTVGNVSSLPPVPLFVAEADRSHYWRQTSYARYTGTTWKQRDRWYNRSDRVPNDDRTRDAEPVDYRIRLLVASSSLPTVWQPKDVRLNGPNESVQVAPDGAFRTTAPVAKNTTYAGRSALPPSSPAVLRNAPTRYPSALEQRYTQLPEMTPNDLYAFTDSLTADDRTPYEQAITIRDWLRTNKEYDLNATHEPGLPIAAQFVFAMDRGYCQYFATAMVAMLRTQGIPARYVIGYAGGDPVGEDEYLVTADRGHAWVEVYFPDRGWVTFDPTPAGELPVENPQPPYNITVNRSVVAGAPVSISVAKNASPVVGAPVLVNDERVGWTDADGNVSTRLPYARNITVTARPPGTVGKFSENGSAPGNGSQLALGGPVGFGGATDRQPKMAIPGGLLAQPNGTPVNETSRTFQSSTNVTLTVLGTPVAGESLSLTATVEDVPLRGATVSIDGEPVGETNASGVATVSLRGVEPGSHRLTVNRSGFHASIPISVEPPPTETTPTATPSDQGTPTPTPVEPIDLAVSVPWDLPLPFGPVDVAVTRAGDAVANASVTVGDRTVGRTDETGNLTARLPVRNAVAIEAQGPAGTTARAWVTGAVRNLAVLVGIGFWLVVGVVLTRRRYGHLVPQAYREVVRAIQAAVNRVLVSLITLVELAVRYGGVARARFRELVDRFRDGIAEALAQTLAGFRRWLASVDPTEPVAALRQLAEQVLDWLRRLLARRGLTEEPIPATAEVTDEESTEQRTLRQIWSQFIGLLSIPNVRTKTPGEIARYAVDRGFPEGPVEVVAEAYREAEYGGRSPDASTLDRVRSALGELRSDVRESLGGRRDDR